MKLVCEGLDLSEAVLKVIKASAIRTTNPVLEGIKLKASFDSLTLTATDNELTIEKTIPADVKIEGEVIVPGKFFAEFVKKLSNEQIELTLTDKNILKIKYTDSVGQLQCLNVDEFPTIKQLDNPEKIVINQKDFRDLINKTIFSVAIDDARPILKGCLFEIANGNVTCVALDGFRLALAQKQLKSTTADFNFIVPARCLAEISKLLDENDNDITLLVQKNYLMVDLNSTKVVTRLLDGDFINYRQVIPNNKTTIVTINKSQLENGLERASLLARMDKNNLVKFEVHDKLLTLASQSDIGNVTENITIGLEGKDISIAFNARYISECLRNIEDEFICLNFTTPIAPCTVTGTQNAEYLYLILPVRIVS
ncbi:MAG: DNA polymerase III subunit beta [Clostridia bacterium]|nr:DNA polymerase III subunit beta [Clostridia bacterium]